VVLQEAFAGKFELRMIETTNEVDKSKILVFIKSIQRK
jgi:hypothetical protein